MTIIQGYRCHWCGSQYQKNEFGPTACSKEHLDNLEAGLPGVSSHKLKLWATFVNHQYSAWSALFVLITGFKPPKLKDLTDLMSGH